MFPQEAGETRGTPSQATANTAQTKRNDVVVRSIGRELIAVKSSIEGMSNWREGVDHHMTQNKEDMASVKSSMASVKQKLDLLIEALLPPGRVLPHRPQVESIGDEAHAFTEPLIANDIDDRDDTQCLTRNTAATERTGSASGVSEETWARNPQFEVLGLH